MKLREEAPVRYLSPFFLQQISARLSKEEAEGISSAFGTIESILNASGSDIEKRTGLAKGFGNLVKNQIEVLLEDMQHTSLE